VAAFGKKALVIISPSGIKRVGDTIGNSLQAAGIALTFAEFGGECSEKEITRIRNIAEEQTSEMIIGVGGGKILDTAKAVAYYTNVPVVISPTVASTDAPCSALSVIMTEDGLIDRFLSYPSNPNMVLLDTEIIAKAPVRLLVSGMGDAMATYFEAKSAYSNEAVNSVGGQSTLAAQALAELCYNTIISQGLKAKLAVEAGARTKAVEDIIEANTLLSGIGFESGGLAAAHAVHDGFMIFEEVHSLYHGEKVAFGVLTQLVLEDYPKDYIFDLIDFNATVGLPITLEDMGIANPDYSKIREVAARAYSDEHMNNLTIKATEDEIYSAILVADAMGRSYRSNH
jgi:glycerol dehydrogenase